MDRGPKNNPFASSKTLDDVKSAPVSSPALHTNEATSTTASSPIRSASSVQASYSAVSTPSLHQTPKPKRTSLIVTLVIVGILLLTGIGFLIWYFAYYNSNGVVLRDAFNNIATRAADNIEFSGSATTDSNSNKISVNGSSKYDEDKAYITVDGEVEGQSSGTSVSLKAGLDLAAKADGSELYFRIRTPDTIDQMIASSDQTGTAKTLLAQATDKWLSFKNSDINDMMKDMGADTSEYSKMTDALNDYQKCIADNSKKLRDDKAVRADLLKAIQDAKAFKIERSSDSDGQKFEITVDSSKIKTLADNIKKSQYVKVVTDCATKFAKASGQDISSSELSDSTDELVDSLKSFVKEAKPKLTFWATTWGHQPVKAAFSLSGNSGGSTISVDFTAKSKGGKPSIELSSNATPVTDVLQQFMATYYMQTLQQQQLQEQLQE